MKFRRYGSLTVAKVPLSEGVTPPGKQLSKTDLLVQISQYGDFVHITDVVDLTVQDAVLVEAAEVLGEQLGETIDELIRDVLAACASSGNCTHGDNTKTPTELHRTDIDGVVKTLLGNKAKMHTRIIPGGPGIGTVPVRRAFWGIFHTDLLDDLEAITGFIGVEKYPSQQTTIEEEWGATGSVRWAYSQKAYVDTSGADDIYYNMIFGRDAYGVVDLRGGTSRNIVKGFGSAGTADALNQRATSGWKTWHASRILNDNFMYILKSTKDT